MMIVSLFFLSWLSLLLHRCSEAPTAKEGKPTSSVVDRYVMYVLTYDETVAR